MTDMPGWSLGLDAGTAISGQGDLFGGTGTTGPLYMGQDRFQQMIPLLVLGAVAWLALRHK